MSDRAEQARLRWERATHAMQTGVATEMELGMPSATEPKHLRVGVNTALCDHGGLVRLLIVKGVITEEEYLEAIADEMEKEAARYTDHIEKALGRKVTLG